MEDAGLHSFIGHLPTNMLEIVFPPIEKRRLSFDEIKEVFIFEEEKENERIFAFFTEYLYFLAKYEEGTINHYFTFNHTKHKLFYKFYPRVFYYTYLFFAPHYSSVEDKGNTCVIKITFIHRHLMSVLNNATVFLVILIKDI